MMKRLIPFLIALILISVTCFAGEQTIPDDSVFQILDYQTNISTSLMNDYQKDPTFEKIDACKHIIDGFIESNAGLIVDEDLEDIVAAISKRDKLLIEFLESLESGSEFDQAELDKALEDVIKEVDKYMIKQQ